MRAIPAALLLVASLAGCAAPVTTDGSPDSDAPRATLPWGLTECRYVVGWAPVEESRLRPYLPEGFTPAGFGARALAGTPAGRVLFGLEAFECASGATLNGTLENMAYGSYWTAATPPEELQVEGATTYTVRWDTLVPDAERRALMVAAGMPARDGTVEFPSRVPVGTLATYEMEDVGTSILRMTTAQPQPVPEGGHVVEFTPTQDGGLAVWRADYAWDGDSFTTGYGVVTVPEGSWAAQVLGGTQAPGQFHAGTWTFSNGTLTLPRGS